MEKIFALLNSDDTEKMTLVEYQLEGNARHWWRASKGRVFLEGTALEWAVFVKAYYDKFFSDCAKDKKVAEFVHLTQKDLTVDQYKAKFAELSRFAPRLVEHEEERARKFMDGLKQDIRRQLMSLNLKDYSEIYERAQLVEHELNKYVEEGNPSKANEVRDFKRKGTWKKTNHAWEEATFLKLREGWWKSKIPGRWWKSTNLECTTPLPTEMLSVWVDKAFFKGVSSGRNFQRRKADSTTSAG